MPKLKALKECMLPTVSHAGKDGVVAVLLNHLLFLNIILYPKKLELIWSQN